MKGNKMSDDPNTYPALGRALLWVERPGTGSKIVWVLAVICLGLFLADFSYEKYGYFSVEYLPGFYGFFGFIGVLALVFVARALGVLSGREKDYYGEKSVDSEPYPAADLEARDHDA